METGILLTLGHGILRGLSPKHSYSLLSTTQNLVIKRFPGRCNSCPEFLALGVTLLSHGCSEEMMALACMRLKSACSLPHIYLSVSEFLQLQKEHGKAHLAEVLCVL